jgi:drug/metabolite transporter (DMT)-like permease
MKLSRRQTVFALLLGIPGTALFMGLLSIAESSVAPGESSVLTYTYPIWVLLLSVPLLGEHLSPRKIAASLLGFGGVILIARIGSSGWSADTLPILELLGGSLGWSITNVAFKGDEIFTANLYQFTGAVLPLLVWAGLSEPLTALRWSPNFLLVLLCLAVFATTIPNIVWFSLVSRYNIATLATCSFLIPVVSLCASFFIFGERLDLLQILGIVGVLSAIYAMNRNSSPKEKRRPERTLEA